MFFSYEAEEEDELTLEEGDIIIDCAKHDGWMSGTLHDKFGMFPGNFVKVSF